MANPFKQLLNDPAYGERAGGNIDPFSALRQQLGSRLFRNANLFGDQGNAFQNSRGVFDPNLAESIRQRAFGSASDALSMGLSDLTGREATFREGQREFNVGNRLKLSELGAEWDAAQPDLFDYLSMAANLASGIGTLGMGLGAKGLGFSLKGLFKGGDSGGDSGGGTNTASDSDTGATSDWWNY